jgi:hypothetical protein
MVNGTGLYCKPQRSIWSELAHVTWRHHQAKTGHAEKRSVQFETYGEVVRVKGLEPPRLAAPEPKSGASTNSATPAVRGYLSASLQNVKSFWGERDVNCLDNLLQSGVVASLDRYPLLAY